MDLQIALYYVRRLVYAARKKLLSGRGKRRSF